MKRYLYALDIPLFLLVVFLPRIFDKFPEEFEFSSPSDLIGLPPHLLEFFWSLDLGRCHLIKVSDFDSRALACPLSVLVQLMGAVQKNVFHDISHFLVA